MGASRSCAMCANPLDEQRDQSQPRKKGNGGIFFSSSSPSSLSSASSSSISIFKQKTELNYKKLELQQDPNYQQSRLKGAGKEKKHRDFPPDKSFSYDFTNFAYCREDPWIKALVDAYYDNLKTQQLEFVGTSDNQNNSLCSGRSLLNQLNEIDSPKGLKVRNFQIALKQRESSGSMNQNRKTSLPPKNNKNSRTISNSATRNKNYQTSTSQVSQNKKDNTPSLEQFEKIKLLCETNLSQVYLCQKDNVPLAMKIIKKSQLKFKTQIENIWRERRILEKLDSSYTVRLEYAFSDEENVYLVTDYKPHGTLKEYLKDKQNLELKDIKKITAQVVACLQYLHEEQKVLYRGLQLDNILLDELMNVCLCDFGNSKFLKSKRQINTSFVFDMKEENMSPEQLKQKHQDTSSDYWQLGILLYQMLYRMHPFKGEDRKQTLSNIQNCTTQSVIYPELAFNNEQVTSDFIEFIQYCLTIDSSKRPKTFYDIQQTSLFSGFEWQEMLESYTSKYSQPNDNLHPCQNFQILNNNHLNLSCFDNQNFLNSMNFSQIENDNYEDVTTTIALSTKNNLNNKNSGCKLYNNLQNYQRSIENQNDQNISNQNFLNLEKQELESLIQMEIQRRRSNLSLQNQSRRFSTSSQQGQQYKKQNSSIDGDDEKESYEEDSGSIQFKRYNHHKYQNRNQFPFVAIDNNTSGC